MAVESLEREVNNGGYDQFFVNAAEYTPVIADSLSAIGCQLSPRSLLRRSGS
jgi:hypothetical protein